MGHSIGNLIIRVALTDDALRVRARPFVLRSASLAFVSVLSGRATVT